MSALVEPLALILTAYLLGSLPFAYWVTRWKIGRDVRSAGSGHASATNTVRQAGWLAGASVLALDLGKGWLAVSLGLWWGDGSPLFLAVLAGSVVAGHCWPVLAGFRGGMGLAAAGGALLALAPLAFVICLGVVLASVLVIRHSARGVMAAAVMAPLALWLLGSRGPELWAASAMGVVLAIRFASDWNRVYRELWLDRESE